MLSSGGGNSSSCITVTPTSGSGINIGNVGRGTGLSSSSSSSSNNMSNKNTNSCNNNNSNKLNSSNSVSNSSSYSNSSNSNNSSYCFRPSPYSNFSGNVSSTDLETTSTAVVAGSGRTKFRHNMYSTSIAASTCVAAPAAPAGPAADSAVNVATVQLKGKRPKRKNHDPAPSKRAKLQHERHLRKASAKLTEKCEWPAGKQCCINSCFQKIPLTSDDLEVKREPLHSLQDQEAKRVYFRSLLLAVAPTRSMAHRLLNHDQELSPILTSVPDSPLTNTSNNDKSDESNENISRNRHIQNSRDITVVANSNGNINDSEDNNSSEDSSIGLPKLDQLRAVHTQKTLFLFGRQRRVTVNDVSVCLNYFLWVYNVSRTFFYKCLSDPQVHRSKSVNLKAEKERLVREWLIQFARYHEYMPNNENIQLPYANKAQVYEYYKRDMQAGLHPV